MTRGSQTLKFGDPFVSLTKLFFKSTNLLAATLFGGIFIALSLFCGSAIGSGNQSIVPLPIIVGDNFRNPQEEQTADAKPKIESGPEFSAVDRIPSGPPWHDSLQIPLALLAAFLIRLKLGFGKTVVAEIFCAASLDLDPGPFPPPSGI
jgi:hypothetical protein